jgi:hypothetical protein
MACRKYARYPKRKPPTNKSKIISQIIMPPTHQIEFELAALMSQLSTAQIPHDVVMDNKNPNQLPGSEEHIGPEPHADHFTRTSSEISQISLSMHCPSKDNQSDQMEYELLVTQPAKCVQNHETSLKSLPTASDKINTCHKNYNCHKISPRRQELQAPQASTQRTKPPHSHHYLNNFDKAFNCTSLKEKPPQFDSNITPPQYLANLENYFKKHKIEEDSIKIICAKRGLEKRNKHFIVKHISHKIYNFDAFKALFLQKFWTTREKDKIKDCIFREKFRSRVKNESLENFLWRIKNLAFNTFPEIDFAEFKLKFLELVPDKVKSRIKSSLSAQDMESLRNLIKSTEISKLCVQNNDKTPSGRRPTENQITSQQHVNRRIKRKSEHNYSQQKDYRREFNRDRSLKSNKTAALRRPYFQEPPLCDYQTRPNNFSPRRHIDPYQINHAHRREYLNNTQRELDNMFDRFEKRVTNMLNDKLSARSSKA